MSKSSHDFTSTDALLQEDDTRWTLPSHSVRLANERRRRPLLICLIATPWVLLLLVAIWIASRYQKSGPDNGLFPQLTYSPIQNQLKYEQRIFQLGFGEEATEYQGLPSPAIDKKWNDLYQMGVSLIPKEEASLLTNKTSLYPHDAQRRYVVELDVFHQLHCLNMIRKALSPEYYKHTMPGPDGEDELLGFHHINHCVDAIRQSLMCTADVTPLVWQWNDSRQMLVEKATLPHTCRNFDQIQEWARERMAPGVVDVDHRELNDPLDATTWQAGYHG